MLADIFIIVGGLFAAGAIVIATTHHLQRQDSALRKMDWCKYAIYVLLVSAILLIAWGSRLLLTGLLLAVAAAGAAEIYHHLKTRSFGAFILSVTFFLLIVVCLGHLVLDAGRLWYPVFAFVFLLVCIMDSYSQLWGKLLGRHRLCPVISPGKTWEGLLGGYATVIASGFVLSFLLPDYSPAKVTIFALVVATAGVMGDLSFSFIKRRLGIKDFSGILPGHGGVLDRFDSLIVAGPAAHWIMKLMQN